MPRGHISNRNTISPGSKEHRHQCYPLVPRQIAGALARRIVTYAEPGDEASIADHMGFIKFGSRIDLYLPLGTEILVKIGDKTEGGVTTVARLASTVNK